MPSNRIGIEAGSVNITGTTNINQNQTTTNNYNSTKTDTIVGYFPETFRSEVPIDHRDHVRQTLDDLKAQIINAEATSDRQPLIVIHGPVSTGKSTAAHFLMADETLDFDNRIRINAQTKKSIERDFRELHKVMRVFQNQPSNDEKDIKLLLKWLYRNLLNNRTLLIFDNVAVLDLDLNSSAFKDVYELVPYLPLRTSLIAGKMVAPTIVITTRAVMNTKSSLFSILLVDPPKKIDQISSLSSIRERLEHDLELILKVKNGKLAAFVLIIISFARPENVLESLIVHFCCQCPQVQEMLELNDRVTKDDVLRALKVLQNFTLITRLSNSVRMRDPLELCVKNGFTAPTVFKEDKLIKTLVSSVAEILRLPKDPSEFKPVHKWWLSSRTFDNLYDTDLAVLALYTQNFNALISKLYPYMLKHEVPTSAAFYAFGFQGNCYELKHKHMSHVLQKTEFTDCRPGSFAAMLQADICIELACVKAVVQGYSSPFDTKIDFGAVEVSKSLLGDPVGAKVMSSNRWMNLMLSLHRMETFLKFGRHDEVKALESLISRDTTSLKYCLRYTYLLSALPPASIQASLLMSQGQYVAAEQLLKTSLDQSRTDYGLHNYTTAALEHRLAKIEAYNGNFNEALKLIEHVIAVLRQFFGVTTVRYVKAVATKARILALRGDCEEALRCLRDVRATFVGRSRQDHPHCLILRYYKAKTLVVQQRYSEALYQLDSVLGAMQKSQLDVHNHYWINCKVLCACTLQGIEDLANPKKILKQLEKTSSSAYTGARNPKALKLDLLLAQSLVSIEDVKATSIANSVAFQTDECFIKLRLKAIEVLLDVSRRSNDDQFDVKRLRKTVDEISKSAGAFHYLTLKYKLVLAETLLQSHSMHHAEVEQQVKPVLDFLDSSEYAKDNVLTLRRRHLELLLLINQKQYTVASAKLDVLNRLVQPNSPLAAVVLYSSAVLDVELERPQKAYSSMTKLFLLRTISKIKFVEPDLGEMNAFMAFLLLKMKGSRASGEAIACCHNGVAAMEFIYGGGHNKTVQAKLNLAIAYISEGNNSVANNLLEHVITFFPFGDKVIKVKQLMDLGNPSDVIKKLEYTRGGEICAFIQRR